MNDKPYITYLLRAIPTKLWEKVRAAAETQEISIRVWLIWAIKNQLQRDKEDR